MDEIRAYEGMRFAGVFTSENHFCILAEGYLADGGHRLIAVDLTPEQCHQVKRKIKNWMRSVYVVPPAADGKDVRP